MQDFIFQETALAQRLQTFVPQLPKRVHFPDADASAWIYRDPERKAAGQFGATVTPETFLLDRSSALVYHGVIGETNGPGLNAALSAFLNEEQVKVGQVPPTGTPIGQ